MKRISLDCKRVKQQLISDSIARLTFYPTVHHNLDRSASTIMGNASLRVNALTTEEFIAPQTMASARFQL